VITTPAAAPSGVVARRRARADAPLWWRIVGGALIPVGLLLVWWIITELKLLPPYRLPSPAAVLNAVNTLPTTHDLPLDILISTQRVFIGFAIGAGAGLVLGAVVGLWKTANVLFAPLLSALRAVPSLAWAPLLLIYLGIFETPKITLVAIGAFFPIFTALSGALRHVDPHLIEMGRAYGLNPFQVLTTVRLPAVIPTIVSGLRLSLSQAWLFLVAAELLGASLGLGSLMIDAQQSARVDILFLVIILLAVLGRLTDAIVGLGEWLLLKRWG
jgi:sulfonate transport system permease protein